MMIRNLLVATAFSLLVAPSAQAEWHEASSKHFIVYADDSPGNVQRYAAKLERFDKAIRVWRGAKEDLRGSSARVTVFLVDSVSDIARIYGQGGGGVAGFYSPRAGGSVAFAPRSANSELSAQAILLHEYAHHWMLTNWTDAALPPWFVEGFAELHATAMFQNNSIIFGAVPGYRRYTVGQTNILPTERLLRFDPGKLSPMELDALYSRGWALTHYLTFDPEGRKRLAAYIGALNGGRAADARSLLAGEGDLDLKLDRYVRRPRLPSAAFDYDQLPIGGVAVRKLTASEAAIMPALMLSKRGVNKKNAAKVAALARSSAAPYPNDAAAQSMLAEAEYDVCDVDRNSDAACFGRAQAAAERALAADPKSVHALVYKGMAATAALKEAKITDAARWAAARQDFLTANRIDPEAPQPLIRYHKSFIDAGQAPTKNADAGLLYAYALAPYDSTLRIAATEVLLRQGKLDEARIAIAPVAYNVEARKRAESARNVLTPIEAKDAAGALAAIRREIATLEREEAEEE